MISAGSNSFRQPICGPSRAMGKSKRKTRGNTKTGDTSVANSQSVRRRGPRPAGWFSRLGKQRPVLRFVLLFVAFVAVFYSVSANSYVERTCWLPYLNLNADVSASILRFLGEKNVSVSGRSITGRGAISIERGCDAIDPSLLFVSAVLASPVTFRKKLFGMLIGTVALMLINLIRILSLYYVQWRFPSAFEVIHLEVWQFLFIVLALVFWVIWARRAIKLEGAPVADAHT